MENCDANFYIENGLKLLKELILTLMRMVDISFRRFPEFGWIFPAGGLTLWVLSQYWPISGGQQKKQDLDDNSDSPAPTNF